MDTEPVLFEAAIVPHRSLSPRGLRLLIGVICVLCGLVALRFVVIRAWPVLIFTGAEVGLAVALLSLNARRARHTELVLLSQSSLTITRSDARGRPRQLALPPFWLRVELQTEPGRVPRLFLLAQGVREEIGASLGETDKRNLAAALRDALHRLRHPSFDNPQLHE